MPRALLIADPENATIEEKLLERLDQAILDVTDNPQRTEHTTAIGTLF